ncbi:MAG: ABC transporter substrate-binding protein, partial [Rhodoferax sp.]|uniref:ABC transporter substrate-binding protein n=1 Tax=Rhodoferax sp. TaxID=50421 RepID=UPI003016131E
MNSQLSRRQLMALAGVTLCTPLLAQTTPDWSITLQKARGQTVYFNAWAGSQNINAYLQWAAAEVKQRYGVQVEHVKITDTAEVVKRVRNEKAAGKLSDGTVDLVWINGENFLAMKREKLLFGPFAETLPSFAYVDVKGKPTTRIDFSEPVDGLEAPWGMAQLTFFADSKRVPSPPRSMTELLAFAKTHPGRVSYPRPPDFHGATFLKQALLEVNTDRRALYQ